MKTKVPNIQDVYLKKSTPDSTSLKPKTNHQEKMRIYKLLSNINLVVPLFSTVNITNKRDSRTDDND